MLNLFSKLNQLRKFSSRKYIKELIQSTGLDPAKLGDKFGSGGQHNLYHYDRNKVIKVAKPDLLHLVFGIHSKKEVLNENKITNKFFPANIVKTEILFTEKYPYYLILQDKIEDYDHLSSYNLQKYKSEFLEILKLNDQLERKGYSLDFFGRHGLKQTFVDSIRKKELFIVLFNLIVADREIKIIDSNLLRISKKTERNFIKRWRFRLLRSIYVFLIKRHLETTNITQ